MKEAKNRTPAGSPLGNLVEGHRDIFSFSTTHEDVLVEAPPSRAAYHKIKPAAVWREQTKFLHISGKAIKLWKKIFLHLFDLVVVNVHILHNKSRKKNMSREIFYENVAKAFARY
jgi:hypothetical protein